jgi:hypothetical protein
MDIRFHTLQEDNGVVETEYYICRADWWPDGTIMAQVKYYSVFYLMLKILVFYLYFDNHLGSKSNPRSVTTATNQSSHWRKTDSSRINIFCLDQYS